MSERKTMPDRGKKVIKGLEWILKDDRFGFGVNWEAGEPRDEYEKAGKIITDTITMLKGQEEEIENLKQTAQSMMEGICLLKEQEAVEPITEHHLFLCPVCKNTLFREQKYCHECGKRIEWKGL